jgi:hypothetical protein
MLAVLLVRMRRQGIRIVQHTCWVLSPPCLALSGSRRGGGQHIVGHRTAERVAIYRWRLGVTGNFQPFSAGDQLSRRPGVRTYERL